MELYVVFQWWRETSDGALVSSVEGIEITTHSTPDNIEGRMDSLVRLGEQIRQTQGFSKVTIINVVQLPIRPEAVILKGKFT